MLEQAEMWNKAEGFTRSSGEFGADFRGGLGVCVTL